MGVPSITASGVRKITDVGTFSVPLPSDITLSDMFLPSGFRASIADHGPSQPCHATVNYTPEQIFDLYSTARSAPTNTYWVDPVLGDDSTGDGAAEGTAWQTIGKAILEGKAAGDPFKVKLKGGGFFTQHLIKTKNFTNASSSADYDSDVDFCVEVYNGGVVIGSHLDFSDPSLHTSASYTYAISNSAADNVLDRSNLDEWNNPVPYQWHPYVATGDLPPGCWSTNGTLVIVRRKDGSAVNNVNTRILESVRNFRITNHISVGLFPETDDDFMIIEGGGAANGTVDYRMGTEITDLTTRCFAARNVTVRGYQFLSSSAGRCWSLDGIHGICALQNCQAFYSKSDLFNFHTVRQGTTAGVKSRALTVNCSGAYAGVDMRGPGGTQIISNNGWTIHGTCVGIDLAGNYSWASGGCVRNIDTTKALCAGTMAHDRGDRYIASSTLPTAFHVNNSAQIWCFRTKQPMMGPNTRAYEILLTGAIREKECWPVRGSYPDSLGSW